MGDFLFCGLDCGKQSVVACAVDDKPDDLKRFASTYRAKTYSANLKDLQKLAGLAQFYFIEPTGMYYRIFRDYLIQAGKTVLLVPSRQVRSYCEHHGLFNKSDRIDPAGIVAYGIEKIRHPRAFVEIHTADLREVCGKIRNLQRQKQGIQALLGQRLCFEVPEWVKAYEASDRDWLDEQPPALWRYLAGETVYNQARRDRELNSSHGLGLSDYSRRLAEQLCVYEKWELELEWELARLLESPEYGRYHQAFDLWKCPNKIRAHILTVIYPFERFLGEDGKPEIWKVIGSRSKRASGLTKRNKSLQSFKLYNGLGMVLKESGISTEWVGGGSAFIRSQWWQWVKVSVVLGRPGGFVHFLEKQKEVYGSDRAWLNPSIVGAAADRFKVSPQLAEAWVHYQELKITKPVHDNQVMLVAGRMATNLFRALLG